MLFDTHAHLQDAAFSADRTDVLVRAHAAGVVRLLVVGTDVETSRQAVALAASHPEIFAAVGIHPHDATAADDGALAEIAALVSAPKVVAIGEIGLDYFRNLSPRDAQLRALRAQLAIARGARRPVLLHCRAAHADLFDVLERDGAGGNGGIMHCFSGDVALARRAVDLGLTVSLAGPVTYPNAGALPAVARAVPRERLVLETDCPYLPPQPWRGQRNEPAYLAATAARVATLLDRPADVVAAETTENAARLLGVPVPAAEARP